MKMTEEFRIRNVKRLELKNFLDKNGIKNIEVGYFAEPALIVKNTESYVKFCVDGTLSYQGSEDDQETLKDLVRLFELDRNSLKNKILRIFNP